MRPIIFLPLIALLFTALTLRGYAVKIIYDSDFGPDVDDVGALAMLHALADNGEAEILGMGVSSGGPNAYYSPSAMDVVNTYYGRGHLPIGTVSNSPVNRDSRYTHGMIREFPHDLQPGTAPESYKLYRKILAGQPDNSVTIVSVGFTTNVANLLKSGPCEHSSLSGKELIRKKLRSWVAMGGRYRSGSEFNFDMDGPSTQYAVNNWPDDVPAIFSGGELGWMYKTGAGMRHTSQDNPVRLAYELYNNISNRESWDQTAVLHAVRGHWADYFGTVEGENYAYSNGYNSFKEFDGGIQQYLTAKQDVWHVSGIIEGLMKKAPSRSDPPAYNPEPYVLAANKVTSTDLVLHWADGGPTPNGFSVQKSENGGAYVEVAQTSPYGEQAAVSDLKPGTSYKFRVIAQYPDSADNLSSNELSLTTPSLPEGGTNVANTKLNLALTSDAAVSGSVSNQRGTPMVIVYDPSTGKFAADSGWAEYGYHHQSNVGQVSESDPFFWKVEWDAPKYINKIQLGGSYGNQPQPNTAWKLQYRLNGTWNTFDSGVGDWLDGGIYQWGGESQTPIVADGFRLLCFSHEGSDIVSLSLRGRGARAGSVDDSSQPIKAYLLQFVGNHDLTPVPSDPTEPNDPEPVLTLDLKLDSISYDSASFSWSGDYGSPSGFELGITASSENKVVDLSASETAAAVSDLTAETAYTFTLKAKYSDGSTLSDSLTATTKSAPVAGPVPESANLVLASDATLSGSVGQESGRGTLSCIVYNPETRSFETQSDYGEYGVDFQKNLGVVSESDPFFWQVAWEATREINYITIGGAYGNQPQRDTAWKVQYSYGGLWFTLESGVGGWIDGGIFEWGGENAPAIPADALRVICYSANGKDLVSIHLRGRGADNLRNADNWTNPKAMLIQRLGTPEYIINPLVSEPPANQNPDPTEPTEPTEPTDPTYNSPDASINLALAADATAFGSVAEGEGRGTPLCVTYDPTNKSFATQSNWGEYGVSFQKNLGVVSESEAFTWGVEWETPKYVNYVTIGGAYGNQPQRDTAWKVQFKVDGTWQTLESGVGGWIDGGIYQWGGETQSPVLAEALRVLCYSANGKDLVSIHLRGRGAKANNIDDSWTQPKAALVQYIGSPSTETPPVLDDGGETGGETGGDTGGNESDVPANATLSLTLDGKSQTSADLSWSGNYGSPDSFTLLVGDAGSVSEVTAQAGETGLIVDNLVAGTTYSFALVAVYPDGNVLTSNSVNATLPKASNLNEPDSLLNLALASDASLSGSVPEGKGRGCVKCVVFDPSTGSYAAQSDWGEYGVKFRQNLGWVTESNAFYWRADWTSPKKVNKIAIGGSYSNQPQDGTAWKVQYRKNGAWITLDSGLGGWNNGGIHDWGRSGTAPVEPDALRVLCYSGTKDLVSIHLRGRGAKSNNSDDTWARADALLIQYVD